MCNKTALFKMRVSFLASFLGCFHFQATSCFLTPSFQHTIKLPLMQIKGNFITSTSLCIDPRFSADYTLHVKQRRGRCRASSNILCMSSDWASAVDPESGKPYWYNTKTSQATWDDPTRQTKPEASKKSTGEDDARMTAAVSSEQSLPIIFVKGTKVMICLRERVKAQQGLNPPFLSRPRWNTAR
jgi:hypothetical protein